MFIASTLHVFDITPGVDASGKPIEIVAEIVGGLIWYEAVTLVQS